MLYQNFFYRSFKYHFWNMILLFKEGFKPSIILNDIFCLFFFYEKRENMFLVARNTQYNTL